MTRTTITRPQLLTKINVRAGAEAAETAAALLDFARISGRSSKYDKTRYQFASRDPSVQSRDG